MLRSAPCPWHRGEMDVALSVGQFLHNATVSSPDSSTYYLSAAPWLPASIKTDQLHAYGILNSSATPGAAIWPATLSKYARQWNSPAPVE